jgi:hypothetical protein
MNDYERLIKDFCALVGLPDHKSIATGGPIEVDGITCSITTGRQSEANLVLLYVEYGAIPSGREVAICEELLSQNYLGSPDAGVTFGYSALSRRVICMQQLRASETTAQRLVDILHHIAEKAVEWRRTFFLKTSQGQPPAGTMPSAASARALLARGPGKIGAR